MLSKTFKSFRNVKVFYINNTSKVYYTRHWQHLNRLGKEYIYIIQEISKTVGNYETISSTDIVLGFETNKRD
jgi:hypothetical protein